MKLHLTVIFQTLLCGSGGSMWERPCNNSIPLRYSRQVVSLTPSCKMQTAEDSLYQVRFSLCPGGWCGASYPGRAAEQVLSERCWASYIRITAFICFCFVLKMSFIYSRETHRERQRHKQREKQAPCREPSMGLDPDPGTPGSRPAWKVGAKLLSHPGIPHIVI